jgi:hypothetical protein
MATAAPSSGVRVPRKWLKLGGDVARAAPLILSLVPANSLAQWTVSAFSALFELEYATRLADPDALLTDRSPRRPWAA